MRSSCKRLFWKKGCPAKRLLAGHILFPKSKTLEMRARLNEMQEYIVNGLLIVVALLAVII